MAVTVISALGVWVVQTQLAMTRRLGESTDRKRALYVAEAGLAEAVLAIGQGKSGTLATEDQPARFHQGVYWVESEPIAEGRVLLTSRARVGIGQFTVRMAVTPSVNLAADAGFMGIEGVEIGAGVVIDGFDSREGKYSDFLDGSKVFPTTGQGALVRSNADVAVDDGLVTNIGADVHLAAYLATLPLAVRDELVGMDSWKDRIDGGLWPDGPVLLGDVRPGPSRTLLTNGGALISDLVPGRREIVIPDPVPPMVEKFHAGSMIVSSNEDLKDASWRIDELIVDAGAKLKLKGPIVLHVGRLEVRPGAILELDDKKSTILIVADDELRFAHGSLLDSKHDAEKGFGSHFMLVPSADPLQDDRITLDAAGDLHGTIVAPSDRVTMRTGLRFWGAAVGKQLTVDPGARLTFDRAFRAYGDGVPLVAQQGQWEIIPEPAPPQRLSFDPLRDLERRGIVPLRTDESSPETTVIADYIDVAGDRAIVTGPAADLDHTDVSRIMSLSWQDPDTALFQDPKKPIGTDVDGAREAYRKKKRKAK